MLTINKPAEYPGGKIHGVPAFNEENRRYVEESNEKSDLAESPAEAAHMVASGRSWPSLKESRTFDRERLAELPLFAKEGRLF